MTFMRYKSGIAFECLDVLYLVNLYSGCDARDAILLKHRSFDLDGTVHVQQVDKSTETALFETEA